jgi:hypothetical protein
MMDQRKPILCVDFDGVIHAYTSKWTDARTISDGPVPGAFDFLIAAQEHFYVVVYSSRSKDVEAIYAMRDWMRKHAGPEYYGKKWSDTSLENVEFVHEKPAAFLTIDDRAFLFEGTWPDPAKLRDFKPWNKRT